VITPTKSPTPLSEPKGRYARIQEGFDVRVAPARRGLYLLPRRWRPGRARWLDENGLGVELSEPLPPGQAVLVRFELPDSLSIDFAGLGCTFEAVVRTSEGRTGDACQAELDWRVPLSKLVDEAIGLHQRVIGAAVFAVLGLLIFAKWVSLRYFWYAPMLYVYSFVIGTYFLSRFVFSSYHEPPPLKDYTPSVSVVIAVRNEQDVIERTIESIYAADYPPEKREVLVVNDGSTDGTADAIGRSKQRFPELQAFTLPPSGKRMGMSTGVRAGKGEIVVFVDSDTILHRMALRHIVSGFDDPTLGAQSGLTGVENVNVNVLTKMQEVRYYLSYKLMKAAEGYFYTVSCCPGCLSAYRREYLLEILDPWLNQRFLGAKATFGDDRSLTNFILRKYRVGYNPQAYSTTMVPETWTRYLTQQVRWKKSWLRETLIASRFMWKKPPLGALSFYIAAMCSTLSPLFVFNAFWWELTHRDSSLLYYLTGLILVGFAQCLYFLRMRPNRNWLLGMVFVVSQVVILGPQTYYAMLTMRRNHWGTR
jgi:hyaluronan synthase